MANEKPVYKYKVVERCFKEGKLMIEGEAFESSELYNSRALEAADEMTAKAVEKLAGEHSALRKKVEPITNTEAEHLRGEVADLKAQLAEALGALKQAASSASAKK